MSTEPSLDTDAVVDGATVDAVDVADEASIGGAVLLGDSYRVFEGGGSQDGLLSGGVRSLPASGGPLKLPELQASWMPLHLVSQIGQFLLPVGPAEL